MADYTKLLVWHKSMDVVEEIYILTKQLPKEELYALSDQLRRAAVSIPSNIAEGQSRFSPKDFCHFLSIARGSAAEVETQLLICERLKYLREEEVRTVCMQTREIRKMLTAMIANLMGK